MIEEMVGIRTRRFGHANLFIAPGSLEQSAAFYNQVVGLEEVRREPDIAAILFSTGQTHHDIAVIEATGEERIGLNGHVQNPKGRGKRAGLNHLGWETASEAELVKAYHRAVKAGVRMHRIVDHQIAHSLYIFDPDGNLNEWYADVMHDWRTVLNPSRNDLVTSTWNIGEEPPIEEPRYHVNPVVVRIDAAIFHPLRITHTLMVTSKFDRMVEHYTNVGGLRATPVACSHRVAILSGSLGERDMILIEAGEGLDPGLQRVAFKVATEEDFGASLEEFERAGIPKTFEVDNDHKRSVFITDPNGLEIEFYVSRSAGGPAKVPAWDDLKSLARLL